MARFVLAAVAGAAVLTWVVAHLAAAVITRAVLAVVVALALVGGAVAQAAVIGGVYSATGNVVAVTPESKTLVIQSNLKGDPTWIVGALVTEQTTFTGRAKSLQDVHPGDRVSLQWVRADDGDIARWVSLQ